MSVQCWFDSLIGRSAWPETGDVCVCVGRGGGGEEEVGNGKEGGNGLALTVFNSRMTRFASGSAHLGIRENRQIY